VASRIEEKQRAREARQAAEQADASASKRRSALLRLGLVLGLAVVVVIIAIVVSSGGSKTSPPAASTGDGSSGSSDAAQVASLFKGIPQKGIDLGQPSAKTTLIEFADLQCPFCAEYSNQAFSTVVKNYVRTGKLRYQLRVRSFLGDQSVTAAGAAAAATKENKLYQFADLFYRRQQQENTGYVTDGFISELANDTGVNASAAVAAAKDAANQPLVQAAEKEAATLGSNSTPDFFLKLSSGRLVKVSPTDLTAQAFTQALDKALAQT
jgi:protein-disulfide isomerase